MDCMKRITGRKLQNYLMELLKCNNSIKKFKTDQVKSRLVIIVDTTRHGRTKLVIGFFVNPIAGTGGKLGWKGTDYKIKEAWDVLSRKGSHAEKRSKQALKTILDFKKDVYFITAGKTMGENILREMGFRHDVIYRPNKEITSPEDTIGFIEELKKIDSIDFLLYAGGDGTTRDILSTNPTFPVVGIPSGVKMYSGCFLKKPTDLNLLIRAMMDGDFSMQETEVMDIDESLLAEKKLSLRLHGSIKTIYPPGGLQGTKEFVNPGSRSEVDPHEGIALELETLLEPDVLYILSSGHTVANVFKHLGIIKHPLTIDLMLNKKIIKEDVNEEEILKHLKKHPNARIIVSPIGGQGFIFGRIIQPISAEVIKKVGVNNVIVIATREKMQHLKVLRIDTGDPEVDRMFGTHVKVLIDFGEYLMKRVEN